MSNILFNRNNRNNRNKRFQERRKRQVSLELA